jgi:hypothetical protein
MVLEKSRHRAQRLEHLSSGLARKSPGHETPETPRA